MTTQTMCDSLMIDRIRRSLRTETVGAHIYLFMAVGSTNAVLRDFARGGAAEGTVVIADGQTAGRGRAGRPWFSPPGVNLYVSTLLRPAITPSAVPVFAFIASLGLTDALAAESVKAAIKWPNDVVVDGRKIGGSLIEYAVSGSRLDYMILGTGVNLNVGADDLRAALSEEAEGATTLRAAAGRDIDRNVFAARLLTAIERWYATYSTDGPGAILTAWRTRDALRGRKITVGEGARAFAARAWGVDDDGCLLVEVEGRRDRVLSGAIRLAE
jgi:BirA family biotin operon repressor/biotin-[acetyl-CoA-carboxylase] ligase